MLWTILWWYLAVINLAAFAVCGWDKRCARRQRRRVPEKTLFLLAAVGGAAGMYAGMLTFRHKTKHWYFVVGIPALLLAQAALGLWLYSLVG